MLGHVMSGYIMFVHCRSGYDILGQVSSG